MRQVRGSTPGAGLNGQRPRFWCRLLGASVCIFTKPGTHVYLLSNFKSDHEQVDLGSRVGDFLGGGCVLICRVTHYCGVSV